MNFSFCGSEVSPDGDGYYLIAQEENNSNIYLLGYDACDNITLKRKIPFKGLKSTGITNRYLFIMSDINLLVYNRLNDEILQMDFNRTKKFFSQSRVYLQNISSFEDGGYGLFGYDQDSSKAFVARFSNSNERIWIRFFNVDGDKEIFGTALGNGEIGLISGGVIPRIYLLDKNGNVVWRRRIFSSKWSSSKVPFIEVENELVHIFPKDSLNNEYILVRMSKNNHHPIWISRSINLNSVDDLTFLSNQNLVLVSGKKKDNESIMVFIDAKTGIMTNALKGTSLYNFINSITNYSSSSTLISGINKEKASEGRIFVQRFISLDEMKQCNYFEDRLELNDVDLTYGTGTFNSDIDTLLFQKSIRIEAVDFEVTEKIDCQFPHKIVLDVNLGTDTTICPGQFPIELENSQVYPNTIWSTGEVSQSIQISDSGEYWIRSGYDCINHSDTIKISQYTQNFPRFDVLPLSTYPGKIIELKSADYGVDSTFWHIEDSLFSTYAFDSIRIDRSGNYEVKFSVKDENDCFQSDSVIVEIKRPEYYIPNSFSPNGDQLNDSFYPQGVNIKEYEILVYNRWGEVVFNSFNAPWFGKNLTTDTYLFSIRIVDYANSSIEFKGTVILMK